MNRRGLLKFLRPGHMVRVLLPKEKANVLDLTYATCSRGPGGRPVVDCRVLEIEARDLLVGISHQALWIPFDWVRGTPEPDFRPGMMSKRSLAMWDTVRALKQVERAKTVLAAKEPSVKGKLTSILIPKSTRPTPLT